MIYVVPVETNDILISKKSIESILNQDSSAYIYALTNKNNFKEYKEFFFNERVKLVDEDKILIGLSFNNVSSLMRKISGDNRRAGWYFQQFIKMAFSFYSHEDNYIIWDSDTVMLRPINFIDKQKKYILYYFNKYEHEPYLDIINVLLGDNNISINNFSFISEKMIINKNIMIEIIKQIEANSNILGGEFWEKILYSVDEENLKKSGFSEFVLYSNYALNKYNNFFVLRMSNHFRLGKSIFSTNFKLAKLNNISKYYESISFEKWDKYILNGKPILSFLRDNTDFKIFYFFYRIILKFRMLIR